MPSGDEAAADVPEQEDDGALDSEGWTYSGAGAESASQAFDGDPESIWETDSTPSHFVVDMKKKQQVTGFAYLPRQDGKTEGMTNRYRFELSTNGKDWTPVSEGEFGNLRANPVEQIISFEPQKARYIRFFSTAALDGTGSSAAELRIFGGKSE